MPRRCANQLAREAFTIIELLVVVSIIVMLLAMFLPQLGRVRETGRQVVCRSNLKQLGDATTNYAHDYDFLPPSYVSNYAVWPSLLRMYTNGNVDVFYCPTADGSARWDVTFGSGLPAEWGYDADEFRRRVGGADSMPFSYGHNNGGTADGSVPPLGVGDPFAPQYYVRYERVMAPSNFMMFGDSLIDGIWDHFIDEDVPGEEPAVRHNDGAFILFTDTHVEHIIPGPYLDLANIHANANELRQRWNNDNQPH